MPKLPQETPFVTSVDTEGGPVGVNAPGDQRSPFTYPAFDLRTMAPLDPLPYVGVSFGQQMNSAGPWSGMLPMADPRVQALEYNKATRTGRTALFVDYLGRLVWGGIIWTRRYQESKQAYQIGAQEFGSYFAQRLQAADYTTTWETGADPLAIAKQVVDEALKAPFGQICNGLTLKLSPPSGSGQSVIASYPGTQLQTIDSIIQTLSQMGYTFGFDYGFTWEYIPGTKIPSVTMNFYYPRQGRFASDSGIVILNKDLLDWTYDEDSTKQANEITETGSGSGGLQPVTAEADNVIEAGYPVLQSVVSHTQVNSEDVLLKISIGDLSTKSWPVTTPALELEIPQPDDEGRLDPTKLTFGQFQLGDDLIWRIDPVAGGGENTSPRFPHGMEWEARINSWTATVADQGVSKLLFDLGPPPVSPKNVLAGPPPLE